MPFIPAAIGAVIGAITTAVGVVGGAVGTFAASIGFGIGTSIIIGTGVIFGLVAGGLYLLSSALKPKPPPPRGSVTQVNVDPNAPQPYVMGEGLVGGALRHDTAYGASLNGVPNPYRLQVIVYSGGGPIQEITPWVDQAAITSYYNGFLYAATQLGAQPESAALALTFSGAPGWDASSKLSGQAAIAWNEKFDKAGKVFASGLPQLGAFGKWVKVYDPRLDSTFPGGSGAHRIGVESTYAWSENPALHAGTYGFGRYQNGKRVLGVGLPADAIDWTAVAAWANVCDANGWKLFGIVYEGQNSSETDRLRNLKDIAAAGGGVPLMSRGKLSFHFETPRIALDTITEADLGDADMTATAMTSWRDRLNTIIPKYLSPDHNWQLVSADPVSVSSYVTEDGEVKQTEWPFNFVKDANQAAQLARYVIEDRRELQPIEITVGPRLRMLRSGDCVDLDLPSLGLDTPAVILRREFDPGKMVTKLVLMGETAGKHAYALGTTGTPPPTPYIGQTAAERDALAARAATPSGYDAALIASSYTTDADPADGLMQATASAITVETHTRNYSDRAVSVTGATLTVNSGGTALTTSTLYNVYYDDAARAGGAVTMKATQDAAAAANSPAHPDRHYVGTITTATVGGPATYGDGGIPPGWDPTYWYY